VRFIVASAGFAAMCLTAATPWAAHAQSTTTTTIGTDANSIWEKIRGSWTQTKGAVKEQWGKLTDDDLLEIQGRREQLVGKIQSRYGISLEEAEAQVSGWEHRQKSM